MPNMYLVNLSARNSCLILLFQVLTLLCLLFIQEKKALKEEKTKQEEKYTWAIVDGVKEKV